MGNALARDLIRESYDVPSWALKYHSSRTEAHEWLELLAKARTQMESVWMNPDSKATMESFEVMKALGVSGPPIVDRSSDQVVNIGLYDFILKYSLFDNDELFKSIRFYVDDPFACITTKSTIHYMVPAINDGMAGYVIFFDERAAEFARLYVVRFCPHVKLDLQNRDNPLYLNSAHIPPLSDLLGFTRYGSPKVQAPLNSIKDSFAIQSLRAWPHLDDLTCATAAHASAMRRQELGERLYPLVAARVDARRVAHDQRAHLREQPHVSTRAGKITGMLLTGLADDELLHLLESSEALNAQIAEAIATLQEHAAGENERGSDERREREKIAGTILDAIYTQADRERDDQLTIEREAAVAFAFGEALCAKDTREALDRAELSSMSSMRTWSLVREMRRHYREIDLKSLTVTSLRSVKERELMRIVFVTALIDYFKAPACGTIPFKDRARLSQLIYGPLHADDYFREMIRSVEYHRLVDFAIYKNAKTRAPLEGAAVICFIIGLYTELSKDAFRSHLPKHVDRALARLRREQKEAQQRIERVISRCVGAAIAAVKAKHMLERREQLDERRRRAELEEAAARQAKLKAERLARAAAPPKRAPKAPAQEPRTARAARLPPPAVEAKLKSARQEAAKEHDKYLKVREAERVAELEELAEKVRIGNCIARGD